MRGLGLSDSRELQVPRGLILVHPETILAVILGASLARRGEIFVEKRTDQSMAAKYRLQRLCIPV